MMRSVSIGFSRLLSSPMKKKSFDEQNKLTAFQTEGLVVVRYFRIYFLLAFIRYYTFGLV
ncbi:uncharacterized protein LOC111832494 [Capsella rubella]|uniref:uncharacterized protein LOC111832494 n=1 Tax=Capsella rubella TaxID=81985 RepID=UPI000CD5248E|nr:uncharacterized protein LOC111832494 [Capsella rubella]